MQDKPETAWITIGEHCCQSNSSRIMQKHILFIKSSQVKLSFIVIPLHVGTYGGTKCRASQDRGAT